MQSVSSLKPELWEILVYKIDKKKKERKRKKHTPTLIRISAKEVRHKLVLAINIATLTITLHMVNNLLLTTTL